GKLKWADLIAPAIRYAKEGFAVNAYLHEAIARRQRIAHFTGPLAELLAPGGKPLGEGAMVKNPELGTVLDRIAQKGPDGFYKGETAAAIVDVMKREGGLITAKDLESYQAVWREPLHFEYRGKKFVTMPPPSSGGVVLAMTANMLRS